MSGNPSPLRGSITAARNEVVLTLTGDLDASNAADAAPLLGAAVATVGERGTLLIDATDLDHLDGVGTAVLADLATQVHRGRGRLTLQGAAPRIYRALEAAELLATLGVEPPTASPALLQGLATVTQDATTTELVDASLQLLVTTAHEIISRAYGVSVTLPRHQSYTTVAASNSVVLAMDHDQYQTRQGPCLDAARHGTHFHTDSLRAEKRWTDFVPLARARGIESIMSSPLLLAGQPLGALNVYSRTAGAFDRHDQEWADEFASGASRLMSTAQRLSPSTDLQTQLQQALRSRQIIAQAQGAVMQRDSLRAEAAYAALREMSRRSCEPLLDICERVLCQTAPGGVAAPGAHTSLPSAGMSG